MAICNQIDLPIIFITGHGNVQMSVKAINAGATNFLEKPFSNETLVESINVAFSRTDDWTSPGTVDNRSAPRGGQTQGHGRPPLLRSVPRPGVPSAGLTQPAPRRCTCRLGRSFGGRPEIPMAQLDEFQYFSARNAIFSVSKIRKLRKDYNFGGQEMGPTK